MAAKYKDWTETNWPYNGAIQFNCVTKHIRSNTRRFGADVILHENWTITDEGNWVKKDGFSFTVRGQYTGGVPDEIKTLDEAKKYVELEVAKKI